MLLIVDSANKSEYKIKECFNEFGFESVEIVNTAEQACSFVSLHEKKNSLDEITLIVIDSDLDDGDGFELCRRLRKTETGKTAHIVILISSMENKMAISKAKQSGASCFSIKPYNSSEFNKHIQSYLKTRTVFIVDDDPVIRKTIRGLLSSYHMEIIEIDDGLKANNLINTMAPPRLVLMDIGLPEISGIQLLEKIRKKPHWKKTPVWMLTGSSDAEDVKNSLLAGANQYITKPFNISDFKIRISEYLADAD